MRQLFLIALCVAAASAFVCPEDICTRIPCKAVTSCNGRIGKGICGCCDVCIVSLREGERCRPYPLRGVPVFSECGFNLVCSKDTSTCINFPTEEPPRRFTGSCEIERAAAEFRKLFGRFIPRCELDGSYSPAQCHGSVCKCVTREGNQIDGFAGPIETNMSCNCARDLEKYRRLGIMGEFFWCEHNGDYKSKQCRKGVCFCVDELGKPISNSGVPISKIRSLVC